MKAQWESEKQAIKKVQALREEIEKVRRDIEVAQREYNLQQAAELRHGRLPELERRLAAEEERLADKQGGNRLLREEVTEEEIAEIVSRWTGIPVTRLVEGEREKLLRLDEVLHQRVVGQDEAVQAGGRCGDSGPFRHQRSTPPDWVVYLPWPNGCGENRTGQNSGRGALRFGRKHGAEST